MKVVLNASAMVPPMTGIGHYTRQLLAGLIAKPDCDLYAFHHLKIVRFSDEMLNFSDKRVRGDAGLTFRRTIRQVPGAYFLRSKMTDFLFKYQIQSHCHDAIYHEPNYILKPFDGACISTVHDLSWLHYPEYHPKERVHYMEREMPKTLERADHFITDSFYVKNEMVCFLGVSPERISVVPLGVSTEFFPRCESELTPVLRKYGLTYKTYLLAVATLEPRKNLQGLLDAFERLPAALRQHFPLVVVGGRGWNCASLEKRLDRLEQRGEGRQLGYVRREELPLIYSGARGFAFPSHYEGFGLPPLEAMASGTPVLVSDNSAMAEVVGDVGIKVNGQDSEAITAGLLTLLEDDDFCEKNKTSGMLRAKNYTWERCVDQTFQVYQQVSRQ